MRVGGRPIGRRPLTSRTERGRNGKCAPYDERDKAQQNPQPGEDEAEVIADCAEVGVDGIAGSSFEIATAEMAVILHVPDYGLDGRTPAQLAFDDPDDTALLAEMKTRCGFGAVWPR